MAVQQPKTLAGGGRWVTIRGTAVFIDGSGQITKGPPALAQGGGQNLVEALGSEMPYDRFPPPKVMYRGTEARTPGAGTREAKEGELGRAVYATASRDLAATYGGGPKASVKKGTREVHELEFTRTLFPEEVGYLSGGRNATMGEAVLYTGAGIELWRGQWHALKGQSANVEAMNRTARESGMKVLIGLDDSIGMNQIGVLDPKILRKR